MLGSGFGLYSVEAFKRDKNRRNKRKSFDKNLHYYKNDGIKNEFPKITEIQLSAIREKMKKQNRKERDQLILSFILAIPVSMILVNMFFKFMYILNS